MTIPPELEPEPRRRSVHLVRRLPSPSVLPATATDVATGLEPHVVLLHDAVMSPEAERPTGDDVTVHLLADDCRRRGLDVPDGAVDYDGLVALMDGAARVVSW